MHALTPIADVMTANPKTVEYDLPLADARDRMSSERIRHLPVVRDGRVVGMLSARDVMLFEDLEGLSPEQATVESAMAANPVTVRLDDTLGHVVSLMTEHDIGAVLINDGGALVGVFTDSDAVGLLHRLLSRG